MKTFLEHVNESKQEPVNEGKSGSGYQTWKNQGPGPDAAVSVKLSSKGNLMLDVSLSSGKISFDTKSVADDFTLDQKADQFAAGMALDAAVIVKLLVTKFEADVKKALQTVAKKKSV
jgi:hypothetical protein